MVSQLTAVVLFISICLLACAMLIQIICDRLDHMSTLHRHQWYRRFINVVTIIWASIMFFITFVCAGTSVYWWLKQAASLL